MGVVLLARIVAEGEGRAAGAARPVLVLLRSVLVPHHVAVLGRPLRVRKRIRVGTAVLLEVLRVLPQRGGVRHSPARKGLQPVVFTPPVQTCPGTWPTGLRSPHGVEPAMGKDALILLSIADANVVDQPPPDSPAMPIQS